MILEYRAYIFGGGVFLLFLHDLYVCYKKDSLTYVAFLQDTLWLIFSLTVIDNIDMLLDSYGSFVKSIFTSFNIPQYSIKEFPVLVQVLVYLLIYDFFSYWTHRIGHTLGFFWQLHIVHHSSHYLNTLSSFRVSWGFLLIMGSVGSFYYGLLIVDEDLIAVVLLFVLMLCHIYHSRISFNDKFVSIIFITPRLHRWHHAVEMKYRYGQNFSAVFTLWDRVFGTFYNVGEPSKLGLDKSYRNYPKSFVGRVLYPFVKMN